MSRLQELLERVEKATGPDRKLDAEIEAAMFGGFPSHLCRDSTRRSYSAGYIHHDDDGSNLCKGGWTSREITRSVDDASDLAGRMLPDWYVGYEPRYYSDEGCIRWRAVLSRPDWSRWTPHDDWVDRTADEGTSARPALAVCAAMLRALATRPSSFTAGE